MAEIPDQSPNSLGIDRGQITESSEGNITAPKNIIQNINSARALYMRYRTDNLGRLQLFASIKGLISGNPPYDQAELDSNGLSHIANFNNMDAGAIFEQGALAYWNLVNQAEYLVKFIFNDEYNPDLLDFAQIMAREWSIVVREWNDFERQVCTNVSQILMFGFSPVAWPDEKDWRWKTVEISRFFLPDQATTDTSLLTSIFMETSYTVQELYEIYKNIKDLPEPEKGEKKQTPWNKNDLANFLMQRANSYVKNTQEQILDPVKFQQMVENGDISFDQLYTDEVRLVSLLQKEYDGKFSHYIFDRHIGTGATATQSGFLFFLDRQYSSIQEFLVIFTASPGHFTIHGNRGLGHKIYSPCQATMQLDCDIVNMARLSSTPMIQSPSTGARDFEPIQFKPGIPMNIGPAQFVQNNLGSNIGGLIGAGNYLLQKLNINLTHSGDDPGMPDSAQGSISPSQARMKSFKEFGVLKNNIAHYYKYVDQVFYNMIVKMLKSDKTCPGYEQAKRWKDRCIELGVPEVLFALDSDERPKHWRVKATRVAGDGSTLALIMGLETLAPFVSSFSAKGVKQFQRDMVMATMGADYVAAYVGNDEVDEISGGASLAGAENALMKMGESPVFSPDNAQRAHITVHMELARYIIDQRAQQQMDARSADKIFAVLIPHLGEHIQAVAQNVLQQNFFEGIKKPWNQIQQYAQLNRKNAEAEIQSLIRKQQEDQAQTEQVLNEEQRKNVKLQGDEARADAKVASQVARADRANETRAEVSKEKVRSDAETKRLKVRLEADVKKEEESLPALREELRGMTGRTPSTSDFEVL